MSVLRQRRRYMLVAVSLGLLAAAGCQQAAPAGKPADAGAPAAAATIGGDAAAGRQLFVTKGCAACHKAPNIPEAQGVVGPDLRGVAGRPKIAALVDNTPQNMKRWLTDPPSIKAGTSMPNLGLTDDDATNITAFLETLK